MSSKKLSAEALTVLGSMIIDNTLAKKAVQHAHRCATCRRSRRLHLLLGGNAVTAIKVPIVPEKKERVLLVSTVPCDDIADQLRDCRELRTTSPMVPSDVVAAAGAVDYDPNEATQPPEGFYRLDSEPALSAMVWLIVAG